MHRLNELILEKMGKDGQHIPDDTDFISTSDGAWLIEDFARDHRDYMLSVHRNARRRTRDADQDGTICVVAYLNARLIASVRTTSHWMSMALCFLAAESFMEDLQAEANAQRQEDLEAHEAEIMSGLTAEIFGYDGDHWD